MMKQNQQNSNKKKLDDFKPMQHLSTPLEPASQTSHYTKITHHKLYATLESIVPHEIKINHLFVRYSIDRFNELIVSEFSYLCNDPYSINLMN